MIPISQNLAQVRKRIEIAAGRSGRDPASIKLVAVSKTKTPAQIREAYNAGQRIFGENYAQELKEKAGELADLDIEWHFIGHLQKNKAKMVAPITQCIESIDSAQLAEALSRQAKRTLECFIEVNVAGEISKSGVAPHDMASLVEKIISLPNIELCGLMVIPPYDQNPENSRPHFKRLRDLLDELNDNLKSESPLRGLSMGMSHDFETAIEEGATIVRVGAAIFGDRS